MNNDLKKNSILNIPELAQIFGYKNSNFQIINSFIGGMGTCFQIQNESAKDYFALKMIHKNIVENENAWKRYFEEIKIWLTLSVCDGVAETYCITKINEIPCVCSRWMKSGNFRNFIKKFNIKQSYDSIIRIVKTLEYAYLNHKIIHRDLKPENLLLDDEFKIYIADWGLAKSIAYETEEKNIKFNNNNNFEISLTQTGQFLGTIIYASPEQILGLKNIDFRTDIYSLGCILYEMETGNVPFTGKTIYEIAKQHLNSSPKKISGFFSKSKLGLDNIIYKCLEKDPNKRYTNYNDIIENILQIANKSKISVFLYSPIEIYKAHLVGKNKIDEITKEAKYEHKDNLILEFDKIEPFLYEAQTLMKLGEWEKSINIYSKIYIDSFVQSNPDDMFAISLTVNFSLCLINTGKDTEAINILNNIKNSKIKPVEYYVNLSLAYLKILKPNLAEQTAKDGLKKFNNDNDLLGNLLISYNLQNKYDEALKIAETRLKNKRDVHSLEEVGNILFNLYLESKFADFTLAATYIKKAYLLLCEAKSLNPRFITVRYNLAQVIFEMDLYSTCLEEIADYLPLTLDNTIKRLSYLIVAKCYQKKQLYDECIKYIESYLNKNNTYDIDFERIIAEVFAKNYIGKETKEGNRYFNKRSYDFFEKIIYDKDNRIISDYCYLARWYEWLGKTNESINVLNEANKINSNFWNLYLTKAELYCRQNNYEIAMINIKKAMNLAPYEEENYWILSYIYEHFGEKNKSEESKKKCDEIYNKREQLLKI